MNATLQTANPEWGFFGTIRHHADPMEAWPLAMAAIAAATSCPETAVRAFLDSRFGRHFADEVSNGLAEGLTLKRAIDAGVELWMICTIGPRTSRKHGIPRGLSYLTGFVAHCEIEAETDD